MIIIKQFENKNILVVDTVSLKTKLGIKNLGYFATEAGLPGTATNGDYAIVGSTDTVWVWDSDTTAWKNSGTASSGDMMKSVYDTDNDGKVDAAETADSVEWSGVQNKPTTFTPSTHNHNDLYYTQSEINIALGLKQDNIGFTPENSSNKGQANGYAPLGADSKISNIYLPSYVDDAITDLQTALNGKVATTGDETINGVKTFSDVIIGKSGIQISPYSDNPTIIFPLGAEGEINMGGHNDLNRFFILNTNGGGLFQILSDSFTLNKNTSITGNLTATNISGTNTGDNAVNSLYSGLATSKQDTLVSGTNIKTVNGISLLGSGNIVISGGSGATKRILTVGGTIGTTGINVGPNLTIDGTYTISQVNLSYGTAGNGTLTVDINKNGTTLFSTTKPSITGTNKYSINTGTLTNTSLVAGDSITIDIDAVPGTPGTDLYIEIIYS